MTICTAVAQRTRQLLKQNKMTVYKLEKQCGLLHGTISNIMYEKCANVTLKTIMQICDGLNISVIEFFDDAIFDLSNFDLE